MGACAIRPSSIGRPVSLRGPERPRTSTYTPARCRRASAPRPVALRPGTNRGRVGLDRRHRGDRYAYRAGIGRLAEMIAPNLRNRGWRLAAELTVPEPPANCDAGIDGVIACQGGSAAGWMVYVAGGR